MTERKEKSALDVVKTSEKRKDWWDELSEEQLSAIDEAETELDRGKGIPHTDVLKKSGKWF